MTRWSLNNVQFTYAAIILIAIGGIFAYFLLPRSEDPGFIVRTARVTTAFPGASPERVENLVTDKLEEAIQEIPEIDYIHSESRTGLSVIDVHLREEYTDIRPIWDNLRRKVDRVRPSLPRGIVGPYVNDEFGDVFGTLVALTGPGYTYAELKDIADLIRDELLPIKDVAKVEIHGVQDERIFVEYNEARLAEMGLSASALNQIMEERNIILPGGFVNTGTERFAVEPSGNFESLDDLRETVIRLPETGETIFLKDIATVTPSYIQPRRQQFRYAGQEGLVLAISMREGGNIMKLGEEINRVLERIERTYPVGIKLSTFAFQTEVVAKIITDFTVNLIQAVVFVIIVMLITLGLRIGLIVASSIPTIILMSFLVMMFLDLSLDQVSLAALVIALGLLVDNAIVINESCVVEISAGMEPKQAAIKSASELKVSLLTASLTTCAAFLPIYLAESTAGEYTASIFIVVTIALLSSWVIAMTMSPLMASQFIRPPKKKREGLMERFLPHYERFLRHALRLRGATLLIVVGLFILAIVGFYFVPKTFFPENARPIVTVGLELPPSSPIERTEEVTLAIEEFLQTQGGVVDWASFIGRAAPRYYLGYSPESPKTEYAYMMINTTTDKAAKKLLQNLRSFSEDQFLDVSFTLRRLEYGPVVKYPIELRIQGRDYEELQRIATALKQRLETIPGTVNINDDWGRRIKKLIVEVDQPRALRAGLSSQDVAASLQTYLTGFETSEFRREEDIIPIVLRSEEPDRESARRLRDVQIFSQGHEDTVVPLEQVADLGLTFEPSRIFRRDTIRSMKVRADLLPGYTVGDVLSPLLPWLQEQSLSWPPGYTYAVGGEQEASQKASQSIYSKLPAAILVIVLLLMGQFNSIGRTAIILCTIPLGLIGVSAGLLITYTSLGFVTFLGVVSLSGIVINNGIVLLDRIKLELETAPSHLEAVIRAGKRRLRPILLTTATTIVGMIPLIYGGGPMFSPMAIAIVSGLIFSTALTLLVVPALYCLLFRVDTRSQD